LQGPRVFIRPKATCAASLCEGAVALPGSKATSRAKGSYRNLGDLISDPLAMCLNGPCREGEEPTPAMYGGEKSDRAIVAMKPVNKAERSAAESVERRARAEGSAVQRYTRVGRSAGVGAPIAGLLRVVDPPLPKVGAVCGKAARTVLCGGRSAMSVPTAIPPQTHRAPREHSGCVAGGGACAAGDDAGDRGSQRTRGRARHCASWFLS
jgi:hypothetical protein